MGINSYKSATSKRIFVNSPFRSGMFFEDVTLYEGRCKALVNFDISNSGDYAYPRPSFVNSILHDGAKALEIKDNTIIQKTNLGKDFLINFQYTVPEETYVTENTITRTEAIKNTYGINIVELEDDLVNFASNRGIKEVVLSSLVSADVVSVYDYDDPEHTTYEVKLLGLNTPEFGEDGYAGALAFLQSFVVVGYSYYIAYDPLFSEKDDDDRSLVYMFIKSSHLFINQHLLWGGSSPLTLENDQCLLYDTLLQANEAAISGGYGYYSTPSYNSFPSAAAIIDEINANGITEEVEANMDFDTIETATGLYFKKSVNNNQTINTTIYDTVGFQKLEMEETDIINQTPEALAETYIEILRMEHTNREYGHTVSSVEMPHANHSWRNAISFLGRIIQDGVVAYKGLITLQYNKTDFKIILIKAEYVDPTTWNINDIGTLAFNAFDDNPFLFEDHIEDETSGYFTYPALSMALIYNLPLFKTKASDIKVISRFSNTTNGWIRPFLIFPTSLDTEDLQGVFMAFQRDSQNEEDMTWRKITSTDSIPLLWEEVTLEEYTAYEGDKHYVNFPEEMPFASEYTQGDGIRFESEPSVYSYFICINYFQSLLITENAEVFDLSKLAGTAMNIHLKTVYLHPEIDKVTYTPQYTDNTKVVVSIDDVDNIILPGDLEKQLHYRLAYFYNTFTHLISISILNKTTDTSYDSGDLAATGSGTKTLVFEGLEFIVTYTEDQPVYADDIYIDFKTNVYPSSVTTQPIYMTGEKYIDTTSVLEDHNVWNATHMVQYDKFLILYGEHMGNHSIQFLEYDNFALAPFPSYQIEYDSEIKHIHNHRGNLYVFTEDGLYILHDGLLPPDMINTFAYSGINLDPTEKESIVSFGNNVFVLSDNKGYSIRTNQNVTDQSDVYTVVLTHPIDGIIESPYAFLRTRLEYGYGIVLEGASEINTVYKSFVINNDLYLSASYDFSIDGVMQIGKKIMLFYIYNKDTKRWRMYDTIVASHPIGHISSNRIRGVDFICKNDRDNTCLTVASFIYSIPENDFTEYTISDVASLVIDANGEYHLGENNVNPVSCYIDSGALGFNQLHRKKIRTIMLDVMNIDGEAISFILIPYMDGIEYANRMTVSALLNVLQNMDLTVDLGLDMVVTDVVSFISPILSGLEVFTLDANLFTTYSKVRIKSKTNLLGNLPGFKLIIPATYSFRLMNYGIVYRQQRAR